MYPRSRNVPVSVPRNDFLFAGTAKDGNGGLGGIGVVTGGKGGVGGTGIGGGLDVWAPGTVNIYSSVILGNHAVGGKGAKGGTGVTNGASDPNGYGVGSGIRNAAFAGGKVNKTLDTIVIANSADMDPDIHGPVGTL